MKFYDMDKIAKKNNINNKYLLTSVVAIRARQISEMKGRILDEKDEKFISLAMDDLDKGRITFHEKVPSSPQVQPEVKQDAELEE
jgi:DNA-directed RNA polymerase subunit K/omega